MIKDITLNGAEVELNPTRISPDGNWGVLSFHFNRKFSVRYLVTWRQDLSGNPDEIRFDVSGLEDKYYGITLTELYDNAVKSWKQAYAKAISMYGLLAARRMRYNTMGKIF